MYRRLKPFIATVIILVILAAVAIITCAQIRAPRDSPESDYNHSNVSHLGESHCA